MTTRKHSKRAKRRKTDRVRRPQPERTGPMRDGSGYFRDSQSWEERGRDGSGGQEGRSDRPSVGSLNDVVTQGVKLGYKVIEQYISQGQRVAEQISRTAPKGIAEPGTADVMQGVVRLYKDMADVWGNALDLMVRNPVFWSWLASLIQSSGLQASTVAPGGTLNGAGAAFSVEITSSRPTEVMLNVAPSPRPYTPLVHALHAPDASIPPLTAIEFRKSPKSNMPVLLLKISSKQPPGLYTGVVVDRDSNEPRGALTVRVLPATR